MGTIGNGKLTLEFLNQRYLSAMSGEESPAGGVDESPVGGAGKSPAGGVEESPAAGAGKSPAGGVGKSPAGGVGKSPAGGVGKSPVGGVGKSPAGGVGKSPAGGVGKTPAGGVEESPAGNSAAENDLVKKLEEVGLSPKHWLPRFAKTLGVTSVQALEYLDPEEYLKIEKQTEYPWEKQALKTLLQKPDSSTTVQERQHQNQEEARKVLGEIKQMQLKGKSPHDKGDESKAMDVPKESCVPSSQSFQGMIEKQHKELILKEEVKSMNENLPAKEVLLHASGGLALEGIYMSMKQEDVLQKREHLIAIPKEFYLTGPEHGPVLEQKEFLSSTAETTFQKSMEKLGFSITCSAKGGFWGFQAEASTDYTTSKKTEQKQRFHTEQLYISTTKYNYIPLASCYIPKDQLCLSSAALNELKSIEELVELSTAAEKPDLIRNTYGDFFSRFGSHANQGPLHFGGIFWWKATSEGFKEEKLDEMKKVASETLNTYVGLSYVGAFNAAAGVDVTKTHSEKSDHETSQESLVKHIQLFITKTGGPLAVDSLGKWKEGLVASNKTWCVVDRGFQLIPVWQIIVSAHKEVFKDAHQVSSDLIQVYEAITNQHHSLLFGEHLASALDEAKLFLSDLQSWEIASAEEQLMKIMTFKQKLNEMTKNYNIWVNICLPNKALHDFLEKVVESYKNQHRTNMTFIKSQIKCLLQYYDYSNENLTAYSSIIGWLYQSEEEKKPVDICDISLFIEVLSQAKKHIQDVSHTLNTSEETIHETNVKVNLNVSVSLNSFLKSLRDTEHTDVELLTLSTVTSLGYSIQNNYFRYLLGWQEIDLMLKEMQRVYQEYLTLSNSEAYRVQAFILMTGLTAGNEFKPVSVEQKRALFNVMVNKMRCSLTQEILDVLERHSRHHDLQSLKRDLNHLISGKSETTMKLNTEDIAKEIKDACQVANQADISTSISHNQQVTTDQTHATITNQDFSNLIKSLELEKYFPKKMNRENLHIINSSAPKGHINVPERESDLPSCFLQMLMTLDYQFRYLMCKNSSANVSNPVGEASTAFDTIDDFLNDCPSEDQNMTSINKEHIHPMDVLMAVYHCADDFLRQYIFTKLSLCQFALPFTIPKPDGSGIELPLWSFRQVQKNILHIDTSGAVKCREKLICEAEVPVVCFTRIGTTDISKSQILNNLLSKHKHDIFFHRHCKGSNKNGVLMKGLVEIFWSCPGGKDHDQFEKCTAFANLRGDARDHTEQAAFLQEIASVNVVMFSDSDRNETGTKLFKHMLDSPKPLICLCPERDGSSGRKHPNKVKIGLKNRNEAELMDELTVTLKDLLSLSPKSCSLETCAKVARKHGFLVDEDQAECTAGKAYAKTMLCLLKGKDLLKAKEELLPLSGHLWHLWCKKDKELTYLQDKMNRSIEQHRCDIELEKQAIRCKQLEKAVGNHFMKELITVLKSLPKTTKLFFLQWLKLLIDDLSSDHILELREQYNELWSQLQAMEQSGNRQGSTLQHYMESLATKMNVCMFGLEHLLREVGQTYEALDALQHKDECFHELPKIAADMMASGYPLELMDGDASYVSLKWIGAVLEQLIKILGDKKLFVLSVLGVQSSGKSTLLNTMFGLQFAASPGRCTRGAFMQLIAIDEKLRQDLNFDYILVIDTEGLRTMELANKSTLNHDNEIATFVIGVGNMTLINVFGENPTEIKDILQIAVQAFLRMKQVKLAPSCLFVHQNVGEITAQDKNMEGRRNLQQELDMMTRIAAEHELCNVQRFSDVIRFDVKKHIHYFAHLWEGNPPMAPPNPIYSQNVQEVRNIILRAAGKEPHHSVLKISELKVRIEDLWSALRNENFVFSFKNTLEISAYSKVETMYSQWTWQLRHHILQLQAKLSNQIKKGDISSVRQTDLEDQVKEKFHAIMDELEIFFSDGKDHEIFIQWKANIENRLKNLQTELVEETKRQGEERIRLKKNQNRIIQKETDYAEELFKRSKQLALNLKNEVLEEEELRHQFNMLWQEWVVEINSSAPCVNEPNIIGDAENILFQYFRQEPCIADKLKDFSNWRSFPIDFSKHVTMNKKLFKSHTLEAHDKAYIEQMKSNLVNKIHEYVDLKQQQKMDYNDGYFHEIINEVVETVNSVSKNKKFTLTNAFKIDLLLYLCHMAGTRFEAMHQAFQRANDPVVFLESKKEEFFNCFNISCQGATSITTFADFLCYKLVEAIYPAALARTVLAVADEMRCNYPAFSGNRSKLETYILLYLAEKEDFEKYREYLHFPEQFFENFIKKCVDDYCFDKSPSRLKNFFNISLDHFQKLVLSTISESTQVIRDKTGSASEWLDEFYKRIADEVNFSRADLKSIEHQEIRDIEFIKEAMSKTWHTAVDNIKQNFDWKSFDSFETQPYKILAKQLCGCWEQCPFCRAICTNTVFGHDGDHSVPFHRSQAISGIYWDNSNEFVTEICSTLVMSNSCLVITDNLQIPYKHYRKVGPNYANWSITPDTSAQHYWKWFVCHFRTNIENDYGCKFQGKGSIPAQWEEFTKEGVIAQLREQL